MNNLSLVNIFGETGRFFYNINYMLNSEHLSLVNKNGDKTEFTITRVHCTIFADLGRWVSQKRSKNVLYIDGCLSKRHVRLRFFEKATIQDKT